MDFINSKYRPAESSTSSSEPGGKTIDIKRLSVGHNYAEMYINLGDSVVLLSPPAAKKMMSDLKDAVTAWEKANGPIAKDSDRKGKRSESIAKKALKTLYKSRKISSKLISINTSRKKRLPPRSD